MFDRSDQRERLSERLVEAFAAFGPAYVRWAEAQMRGGETTYTRMRLLAAIYCSPRTLTMGEVAVELGVTRRNVTGLVDALEGEGLVRRRLHPDDRRSTLLELTEVGTGIVAEGYPAQVRAVSVLFDDLSKDRQRALLATLDSLQVALKRLNVTS